MKKSNYDDIINLSYPYPTKRRRMSVADRAAQFSPFAALTGHDAAIAETGRLTDDKIELGEDAVYQIEYRLTKIAGRIDQGKKIYPKATILYFQKDAKKSGGAYLKKEGCIKKIDEIKKIIEFEDGISIRVSDILEIDGEDL